MSKKVKISKLTPEQIEKFKHSISSIIENYEPINKTLTQVMADVYKQLEPIKIQMPKIQIEPVNYKTMIDSISKSLSSSQNIGFQKFILDNPVDKFYELENESTQIKQSEQNNNEFVESVQINQININIHNHYPPNTLNVFNLISNLMLLLEFLKIINAPEETIKIVTDFIKSVLDLLN